MTKTKSFFSGFRQGMKGFGCTLSSLINAALLTAVYFIGVGTSSLAAKVTKKRFLDMRLQKKSYWKALNLKKRPLKHYYRQF